jgi:hypothetical protein
MSIRDKITICLKYTRPRNYLSYLKSCRRLYRRRGKQTAYTIKVFEEKKRYNKGTKDNDKQGKQRKRFFVL